MNDQSPFAALQRSLKELLTFLDAAVQNKTQLQLFQDWLESAPGGSIYHYATGVWLDERKRCDMSVYIQS